MADKMPGAPALAELELKVKQAELLLSQISPESRFDFWCMIRGTLGEALRNLGAATGDEAMLRRAEEAHLDSLKFYTREKVPSGWCMAQNFLGDVYASLGKLTDDVTLLRRAEAAYIDSLGVFDRAFRGSLEWAMPLTSLADLLLTLYDATGDVAALDRAEAANLRVLNEADFEIEPENQAALHNNLGIVMARRGAHAHDAGEFLRAEAAYRRALEIYAGEGAWLRWANTQHLIGDALRERGDLTGDAAELRRSEPAYHAALTRRTREGEPVDWANTQRALGTTLLEIGQLSGDTATLDAAAAAFRAALLVHTRDRHPAEWGKTTHNLAIVIARNGIIKGDVEALRLAETRFRESLSGLAADRAPVEWATMQNGLGGVLSKLGDLSGDRSYLEQAEAAHRAALAALDRKRWPMEWAATQLHIGMTLQGVGEQTGDAAILGRAETAYREVLKEYRRDRAPMRWANVQNCLGAVLRHLGDLDDDVSLLKQAEDAFRAALGEYSLARTPTDWAGAQNNLSITLLSLGKLTGDAAQLGEAEEACRAALKATPRGRAPMQWAAIQNNLGNALRRLGDLTGDPAALIRSAAAHRRAAAAYTRERAPAAWAGAQNNLAGALIAAGVQTGDTAALERGVAAYRTAVEVYQASDEQDTSQSVATAFAMLLGYLGRYGEASALAEATITRSDAALMEASRSAMGRARAVAQVSMLHGLLSFCRLRQEKPDRSAAMLAAEAGRARLLSDSLSIDAVRPDEIEQPEIRQRIAAARDRRNWLRAQLGFAQIGSGPSTRELSDDDRRRLQAELHEANEIYTALCRQHGLVRAPAPPTKAELAVAIPRGGALVLPLLFGSGTFVFIFTERANYPTVIEMPHLSRDRISERLSGEDRWLGAYDSHFRAQQGKSGPAAARWRNQIAGTMTWIWETFLTRIDEFLRDTVRLHRGAEVVLMPSGLLGLLPLHAAGPSPDGPTFGDHWTVSYAPGMRAHAVCQARARARTGSAAPLLAVLDPDGSLPGARAEATMLKRVFGRAEHPPDIHVGAEAKLAAVMARLPAARCFHASTHGAHNVFQPTLSSLKMADGELTLDSLRHARLDSARLVFLSACESGLAGVQKLPDEFIGLPAGFVQAGAACVIGSLWPIRDDASFLLATRFYAEWLDENGCERARPVDALRAATDWLRRVTFAELRTMFEMEHRDDGDALLLRSRTRFEPASSDRESERETADAVPSQGIHLPIGADDARPFEHPEHWAAFTCTGA
jgi:CHAT domain-containing protein/tetratricopeptide (TPR) repeat protein